MEGIHLIFRKHLIQQKQLDIFQLTRSEQRIDVEHSPPYQRSLLKIDNIYF